MGFDFFNENDIWVDAKRGKDGNPGTIKEPVATMEKAYKISDRRTRMKIKKGLISPIVLIDSDKHNEEILEKES